MRVLELMDGKAIGLGIAVYTAVLGLGLLIVGMNPSDTEMHLVFWPAAVAGFAVTMVVVHRNTPDIPRTRALDRPDVDPRDV